MTPDFDAIAAALATHERVTMPAMPGHRNHLPAGVLLPLRWRGPRLELIAILRAADLREHGGEVGFAGGRPEAEDGGELSETALREAREELGIDRARLLGRLSSMPLYTSDYRLFPFVAALEDGVEPRPESKEVAEIVLLDIAELLARPHIDAMPYRLSSEGRELASPLFWGRGQLQQEQHLMYGATAHVCLELLGILAPLFGQALPPFDTTGWSWNDRIRRPEPRRAVEDPAGDP